MSTTAPLPERTVVETLLSLWRRGHASTTATLLRDTLAPLPDVAQSLEILQNRGCLIQKSPEGTLHLIQTGLPCWRDVIESEAKRLPCVFGQKTIVFASTASTNDVCWQYAAAPASDGLIVLADEQTAGRGRRGNAWSAKPGQSVLMSILLLRGQTAVEELTLRAGLAVAEALEEILAQPCGIKWPNDVLINGRKIAGILVETRQVSGRNAVVIGVGTNVNQATEDFPEELQARATSCRIATGNAADRLRVVEAVLSAMERRTASPREEFLAAWKSRCTMLGQRLTLEHAGLPMHVEVVDVDPLEGLVVRDESGTMRFLPSQTTTLRVR